MSDLRRIIFRRSCDRRPGVQFGGPRVRGWVIFIDALRHLCPGLTNLRFVEVLRCRLSGSIFRTLLSRGSQTLQSTSGHLLVLVMSINSTWTCRSVRMWHLSCLRWRLSFVLMVETLFRGFTHQHLCNSLARVRDDLLTTFRLRYGLCLRGLHMTLWALPFIDLAFAIFSGCN